jgi:4-hydroxybenzoate polyprenyltransferase
MKKYSTPINIFILLWGFVLIVISELYSEYVRYYLYLSLIIMIPIMIWNLIKQKKNDKVEGTKEFQFSIYRMLFMAVVLVIMFYMTKQNHI